MSSSRAADLTSDSGCPALKAASTDAMGSNAGKEVQVRKDRQVKSVPHRPFEGKKMYRIFTYRCANIVTIQFIVHITNEATQHVMNKT